jgi:SAM-dependent methyltransferase
MDVDADELRRRTLDHYKDKFAQHGPTALGVDWNGPESQRLQFAQLLKLLPPGEDISVNDFGCGYGALVEVLQARWPRVRYRGYDLNPDMIAVARERYSGQETVRFDVAERPLDAAEYGMASGVFTLRLGRSDAQCFSDMQDSLDALHATSRDGFAFNTLTSYSDADRMRDYLYYPNPCDLFDLCKRRYARDVALLHDYGLYACTLLVRKTRPVSS